VCYAGDAEVDHLMGRDLTTSPQVCTLLKPLKVTLPGVDVGVFLLDQFFKRLDRQTGD